MNSYRISHYSIVEKLGAGGMGEVYKAHDTTLDRPVALKILPPDLVEDQDRLRRFVQEAKSASALNHPHIITIYEIGEAKPQTTDRPTSGPKGRATGVELGAFLSLASETPVHYIAMEYIEGETLHAKIHGDKATLRKLLEYLVQAADGLAKAHAAGIIHRDLKPDNIMINKDGYSKILDFGLAKLIEPVNEQSKPTQGNLEEAATALMRRSQAGMVMGTVGYMSPEQAQGKTVDQRSDIFAFGCILYEVATGHKPFEGDSLIDSLHKIIYTPAPPIKDFNPNCPYDLRRIIGRCLTKDPDDRYQRVKDISMDLREFLEEYKADSAASGPYSEMGALLPPAASGGSLLDAPVVKPHLEEIDPRVLQLTRFSKSSVALSVLGLVGAIVLWPMYKRAEIGSELRLDYTKEAALSKAREIVSSLGYDTTNLENYVRFVPTNLDLKHIAAKEGIGEARRAVREGKSAAWRVAFARSTDEVSTVTSTGNVKPGQFLVAISPQGQLVSFSTPPREDAEITEVDKQQAVVMARETARRWLSFDPGGYEAETVPRSNPPGVIEITWRNPNPIFAHKEVVQANLQGSKITKLNRSLEPVQLGKEIHSISDSINTAQIAIVILACLAIYIFGLLFLILGKRWYALGRNLPITALVLFVMGVFVNNFFATYPETGIEVILIAILGALMVSIALFPGAAGLFEWLRVFSRLRLFGAEQLVNRRFLSASVASSLVHGTLVGAFLAGIDSTVDFLVARVPGYSPSRGLQIEIVDGGWPLVHAPLFLVPVALLLALCISIIVELTERFIRGRILAPLIAAVLIAVATIPSQPRFLIVALSFLGSFLVILILVQLYRLRGLAAVWLALTTLLLLIRAAASRYLQDPNFVLQSNLLILVVALLLTAGVWGYLKGHLKANLSAFGVR